MVGIFPDILSKLVKECCYEPPSQVPEKEVKGCVQLNFTEVASNDSEVVKKHIGRNGIHLRFLFYCNTFLSVYRLDLKMVLNA